MSIPAKTPAPSRPAILAGAILVLFISFINSPLSAANTGLAHSLSVELQPDSGEIRVDHIIRADQASTQFEFVLNAGLHATAVGGRLDVIGTSDDGLRIAHRVTLQTPGDTLKLHYHGKPRFSPRLSLGDMPQGIVSPDGVYLDASSAWYPQFAQDLGALEMTVRLPDGWESISIGRREERNGVVTWTSGQPYDQLYLIAGRYTRHARRHGDIDLSVWLLGDDPALADRYLGLMGGYIDHYSRLIGPYPYEKFAVVENSWQTGFGMPSFTLLGSRVLRLPFIPYTSLPHEILHNWWGNGVWVDYLRGNWSEGLTAYLADHWMQERQGKGDQYRLKALQRYSNFAARGQDAPLLDFVSRHNDSTQSIGYSKSLMLFHMLRNTLGDEKFVAGLQRLWQQQRYRRVGFNETIRSIAGATIAQRFMPWLERSGAPEIVLSDVRLEPVEDGWRLALTIDQVQEGPFAFDLPVLVTLQGEKLARREVAHVSATRNELVYRFANRPLRVDIDPEYDVLRTLDATEQPPALNRLFGSDRAWLVLPSSAPPAMRAAWERLATLWQERYPGLRAIDDVVAGQNSDDADRILLGWDNALLPDTRAAFTHDDQRLGDREVDIGGTRYAADASSVVLVSSDAGGMTTGFVGAASADAVDLLAQKLTHYGSYGRLVFDAQTDNRVRDTLSSSHSRLSRQLGPEPVALRIAPRPPLGAGD